MIRWPAEAAIRRPLIAGFFIVALGFFFFETYGAFLGRFEDEIVTWQTQQIEANPSVVQTVEGQPATPEQAAGKAWERIKFFHGHGYLMVLATFVYLVLIASVTTLSIRSKAMLMWVSLVAMWLYNIGWGLAGWLVPWLGAKPAKQLGETFFFLPFGLTIVVVTGILTIAYLRQFMRGSTPLVE